MLAIVVLSFAAASFYWHQRLCWRSAIAPAAYAAATLGAAAIWWSIRINL
jgi:hypothetical protein